MSIEVKHFSISHCFCKHAAQHFGVFFRLSCMWNRTHFFKPQKLLQDERKGRRNGFFPSSSQPLSWLRSLFSAQICAVNMGAKPHRRWCSQQDLPNHCSGMHGYLLSPPTCSPSGGSPTLLWSAVIFCHGSKDPSYMSFDVKNLYHFITVTSFSLITALEIAYNCDH